MKEATEFGDPRFEHPAKDEPLEPGRDEAEAGRARVLHQEAAGSGKGV